MPIHLFLLWFHYTKKDGIMKKIIALLSGTLLLAGCFDSSSTSASNTPSPNETSSSSTSNPTSSFASVDLGEGYTFATTYTYDESTGLLNMGTVTCNYQPDSKSFIWGENNNPLYKNKIKIIGDSMWIGPLERRVSEDSIGQAWYDRYDNLDTLALSIDNNGILGSWTVTTCTRTIGKTEINCTPENDDYIEDHRAFRFTPDSVYITMMFKEKQIPNVQLSDEEMENERAITSYSLFQELGYNFDPFVSGVLERNGVIKIYSNGYFHKSFSIIDQPFERNLIIRLDSAGMYTSMEFSSNEKKCQMSGNSAFITKKLCLEGNKDILLSNFDEYRNQDGGPLGFYATPLYADDYENCLKELVNEEARDLLSQVPHSYD